MSIMESYKEKGYLSGTTKRKGYKPMSKEKFIAALRMLLFIVLCIIALIIMMCFFTLTGLAEHIVEILGFIRKFPTTHLKDVAEIMLGALCIAGVVGIVYEAVMYWRQLLALLDCIVQMLCALVRIADLVSDDPGEIFDEDPSILSKFFENFFDRKKQGNDAPQAPKIDLCADMEKLTDTILMEEKEHDQNGY